MLFNLVYKLLVLTTPTQYSKYLVFFQVLKASVIKMKRIFTGQACSWIDCCQNAGLASEMKSNAKESKC